MRGAPSSACSCMSLGAPWEHASLAPLPAFWYKSEFYSDEETLPAQAVPRLSAPRRLAGLGLALAWRGFSPYVGPSRPSLRSGELSNYRQLSALPIAPCQLRISLPLYHFSSWWPSATPYSSLAGFAAAPRKSHEEALQ